MSVATSGLTGVVRFDISWKSQDFRRKQWRLAWAFRPGHWNSCQKRRGNPRITIAARRAPCHPHLLVFSRLPANRRSAASPTPVLTNPVLHWPLSLLDPGRSHCARFVPACRLVITTGHPPETGGHALIIDAPRIDESADLSFVDRRPIFFDFEKYRRSSCPRRANTARRAQCDHASELTDTSTDPVLSVRKANEFANYSEKIPYVNHFTENSRARSRVAAMFDIARIRRGTGAHGLGQQAAIKRSRPWIAIAESYEAASGAYRFPSTMTSKSVLCPRRSDT
jgi:hypothetical protein